MKYQFNDQTRNLNENVIILHVFFLSRLSQNSFIVVVVAFLSISHHSFPSDYTFPTFCILLNEFFNECFPHAFLFYKFIEKRFQKREISRIHRRLHSTRREIEWNSCVVWMCVHLYFIYCRLVYITYNFIFMNESYYFIHIFHFHSVLAIAQ